MTEKFVEESEEIKYLKQKFAVAELNKQRMSQIQEQKLRQVQKTVLC